MRIATERWFAEQDALSKEVADLEENRDKLHLSLDDMKSELEHHGLLNLNLGDQIEELTERFQHWKHTVLAH